MRLLLRRRGVFLTITALMCVSLQLFSLSLRNPEMARVGARAVRAMIFPLERFYHEVSATGSYVWTRYVWLLNVEQEKNQMARRVGELEAMNSRLVEYSLENQRLKELLQFSQHTGYRGQVAEVVGRNPSNWHSTVTIDRGSADGIRSGLAVVSGNSIVGQTTVVAANSAVVLLVTDVGSAVDSIVQASRVAGIVEGVGDGSLRLRYAEQSPEHAVKPGERVIASGLDGVFPKGASIGVVHRVNAGGGALFQEIYLKPSVEVERIEAVMVLMPERSAPKNYWREMETLVGLAEQRKAAVGVDEIGKASFVPQCNLLAGVN